MCSCRAAGALRDRRMLAECVDEARPALRHQKYQQCSVDVSERLSMRALSTLLLRRAGSAHSVRPPPAIAAW